MTKREKIINLLKERGWKEEKTRSKKYEKFSKPGRNYFIFVGKKGAVRIGKSISDSISLGFYVDDIKKWIKIKG